MEAEVVSTQGLGDVSAVRPVKLSELFVMACESCGVPIQDVPAVQRACEDRMASDVERTFGLKWEMERVIRASMPELLAGIAVGGVPHDQV